MLEVETSCETNQAETCECISATAAPCLLAFDDHLDASLIEWATVFVEMNSVREDCTDPA